MDKQLLINHYTSFEGFYSSYFSDYKVLSNGEWEVLCPFHDDHHPSLNVNVKTGMYFCHSCHANGDFIKFYMLKHGKDFPDAVKEMCMNAGLQEQKPRIVKEYDYLDADGNLVSQTIRFEPKKFSQRTKVNGQWVWNLKGVDTVLYNLPNVLTADTVLVMEGEKDCDTAKEIGFTATTCPMGAGKWREKYNQCLTGKEIILFPDNDPVGIKHMLDIGRTLQNKSTVKWFDFPGTNPKGYDFTDFVKAFDNEFEAIKNVDILIRSARVFNEKNIIIPEPDTPESDKIKEWVKASPGEFSIRDIDYDLGFKEPVQKELRTKILEKFVSEKIISREGKKRGHYRPYKIDLEVMDFMNAKDNFLPVRLPMGISDMVGIMPGNIIIIAGEPNAGKTALMLNIIKMNMYKFNVHYFNSEMGEGELKGRLSKFEDISLGQWKFNSYSRDTDFADVVFTGEKSLNIIDFLEIHDDFYAVGEKIKQIHTALKGAIAIIAIQKNKGSEFGLGGNRTMEKARLVINVEPGRFKITKAKNFINPKINPNGLTCDWKLANGWRFIAQSVTGWYKR